MIADQPGTPELGDLRYCDPKLAAKVASKNKVIVLGFKIRINSFSAFLGLTILRL
jgi:hypothetical protein